MIPDFKNIERVVRKAMPVGNYVEGTRSDEISNDQIKKSGLFGN